MDSQPVNLWRSSPAWRWLFAAALLCTAVALLGTPWRAKRGQQAALISQFDANKVSKPNKAPLPPTASNRAPVPVGGSSQLPGASATSATAPVSAGNQTNIPPFRSGVVWSNAAGSVSGSGLIAAYCCAGPSSTVRANRGVNTGRHYWELTLSVRPGEQNPDTWTTAGVSTEEKTSQLIDAVRASRGATADSRTASFSAIGWNQQKSYRNGDVLMFALDAERGLVHYGVNGQWRNGQPGESGGEPVGRPGATFIPYVNISASTSKTTPEGDRWIANFGGSAFRFPIPTGFDAYGTSAPVQASTTGLARTGGSPVSQSPVGKFFDDEIVVGGQRIPLPPGKWRGLAFFRGQQNKAEGDSVLLGKFEKGAVSGIIGINAYTIGAGTSTSGFPAFAGCDRNDYLHVHRQSNEAFGAQRCWWVNHGTQVWDQPLFRAAKPIVEEHGAVAPALMVNVAFRRATINGFATAFYYFNPEEGGIASQTTNWSQSEWHMTRISTDPSRVKYVKDLIDWGNSWAPVFYTMSSR
jgi:hypothetical protein